MTGKSLEDTIEKETGGVFKRVLVAILQARRESGNDEAQARQDAMELYNAGEKYIPKWKYLLKSFSIFDASIAMMFDWI